MAEFTVTVEGKEYDVTAPDERTAWKWANATHAKLQASGAQPEQESPTSLKNIGGAAIEPNLALASGAVAAPVAGLTGIAGSLLPGPEGQGAQWTNAMMRNLTYEPRTQGGKAATEAISYPFQKMGEGADYLGEQSAELTGSPAVGAGVKAALNVGGPLALAKGLRVAPAAKTAQGSMAKWMMRKATKPSAAVPKAQSERALDTMLEEGINPTLSGMEKAQNLGRTLNTQVEQQIADSPAMVNVARVGSRLRDPHTRAKMQVNPNADVSAIRSVWDEFRTSPNIQGKMEIPVSLAQKLKQGTYRALGNKSYGELGSASTEAQKALARGLREETIAAVPEIKAPLQREANLMNVLDVAERRALSQANNNPAALALLTHNKAAFAAFLADRSAAFKGTIARTLYGMGNPEAARIAIASGATSELENRK